jgi:hypothetical protein
MVLFPSFFNLLSVPVYTLILNRIPTLFFSINLCILNLQLGPPSKSIILLLLLLFYFIKTESRKL